MWFWVARESCERWNLRVRNTSLVLARITARNKIGIHLLPVTVYQDVQFMRRVICANAISILTSQFSLCFNVRNLEYWAFPFLASLKIRQLLESRTLLLNLKSSTLMFQSDVCAESRLKFQNLGHLRLRRLREKYSRGMYWSEGSKTSVRKFGGHTWKERWVEVSYLRSVQ